ncbi:hypothetical protein F5Y17DRAFT_454573 [Xylariaceae sp. FL0594]|nr:hypothetical protein F5Y17DRAFT_454573 [Xylariaceae sp. FL0594]
MRLINVKTLKPEEFIGDSLPKYAILSHTWADDSEELTLRDVERGNLDKPGIGSAKLKGSCREAEKDGLDYIWIDTCCIDKADLVELSEAINSMFRWYQHASICYAYLSDVPDHDTNPQKSGSKFRMSRWFQRGWTLQELLAPKNIRFYNSAWAYLGTKGALRTVISKTTGIPLQILLGISDLRSASVAQRMAWASGRETKRKEDMAYCLLGIFGVTMPMIYGEGGEQAFFRLQDQIMKTTRDDSILAWDLDDVEGPQANDDSNQIIGGRILAASPSCFANSRHILCREQSSSSLSSLELSGGHLRLHLSLLTPSVDGKAIGLLNCGPENDPHLVVGIPLVIPAPGVADEYVRPVEWHAALQPKTASNGATRLVYIRNDGQSRSPSDVRRQYWLYDTLADLDLELTDVSPRCCWDKDRDMIISTTTAPNSPPGPILARFRQNNAETPDFVMLLEFKQEDASTEPQCLVMICPRHFSLQQLSEKFPNLAQRAFGREGASNGLLHLRVTMEVDTWQLMFTLKPERLPHPPDVTIDVAREWQSSDLALDLYATDRMNRLETSLEYTRAERARIEEEIEKLTKMRTKLIEEEDEALQKFTVQDERHDKLIVTRNELHEQWSVARIQWDRLWNIERDMSSYNLTRMDYETPLHWAARAGDEATVQRILRPYSDIVLAGDEEDRTALYYAGERGHSAVVQLLIRKGGQTTLQSAFETGNADFVKQLLDNRAGIALDDNDLAVDVDDHVVVARLLLAALSGNGSSQESMPRILKDNPKFCGELLSRASILFRDSSSLFFFDQNLLWRMMRIATHQQVLYCDDSKSMKREGRWDSQNKLIMRIASLTSRIVPEGEGVYLRYINQEVPNPGKLSAKEVLELIKPLSWGGDTPIATNLRSKILEPLVYSKLPHNFKRSLLISVITDGVPEPEPRDAFVEAVMECGDMLEKANLPRKSVRFVVVQVGTNKRAEAFIQQVGEDQRIKEVVYVVPNKLDEVMIGPVSHLDEWIINTLYRAVEA